MASGADRHLLFADRHLLFPVVESSSLVSVLFREAINHPYISFFHLLVNDFSVIIIGLEHINQLDKWTNFAWNQRGPSGVHCIVIG